jgi:murein DD-endopeptidase MepM/ murein hydrolase activator NlpD
MLRLGMRFWFFKGWFRCLVVATLLSLSAPAQSPNQGSSKPAAAQSSEWSATANPEHLVNGAPLLFEVKPPSALASLTGTWLTHAVTFAPGANGSWFSLAGISLETEPGTFPLELTGTTKDGQKLHYEQKFSIASEKYETVELKVSKDFTAPSPEQMEIIKRDQEIKKKTFAEISPDREWAGPFRPPVDAPVSDVFGTRRVFNGVTKSVHQGLDYRVPAATPVSAVNAGTVILARLLYFEGNCVVIDHGQGLLTLYLHLSEFKVKEGDVVKRGQLIGLSGATGRATGPHLHIAVRWQGTYLNPAVLLSLPVPSA